MFNVYYRDNDGNEFFVGSFEYHIAQDKVDMLNDKENVQRAWIVEF